LNLKELSKTVISMNEHMICAEIYAVMHMKRIWFLIDEKISETRLKVIFL
jgi:hypothetical protein